MAKNKVDAVSLFGSMMKNEPKMTEEVIEKAEKVDIDQTDNEESINWEKTEKIKENEAKTIVSGQAEKETKTTTEVKDEVMVKANEAEVNEPKNDTITDVTEKKEEKEEAGTKAEKELQHIHIALPKDVFEKLEIGKKAYYNNKTTYIRNLILNDYEKNKDYYESLPNIR